VLQGYLCHELTVELLEPSKRMLGSRSALITMATLFSFKEPERRRIKLYGYHKKVNEREEKNAPRDRAEDQRGGISDIKQF